MKTSLSKRRNAESKPRARKNSRSIVEDFVSVGLPMALCLGSKSGYRRSYPKHFLVPNAHVVCRSHGLVWWGDVDIWRHRGRLERAARKLGCRLYVLPEDCSVKSESTWSSAEIERVALWHTGGRVRPNRWWLRRSGLRAAELSSLLRLPMSRLVRPQLPYVVLQINQRLRLLEGFLRPITRDRGFKRWGDWMRIPHLNFKNRSPLAHMMAGGNWKLADLFPEIYADRKLVIKFREALHCGVAHLHSDCITLQWPRNNKTSIYVDLSKTTAAGNFAMTMDYLDLYLEDLQSPRRDT